MNAPLAAPDFLAARGARMGPAGIADFGKPDREWDAAHAEAVVADSHLAPLTIEGADAADFLQGQLSSDVKALVPGQGQWTTYNSPKGRMLATAYLVRDPVDERYWALLPAALATAIAKRLSMFVLRAKTTVQDASASHFVLGVGGPRAARAVHAALGAAPDAGTMIARDAVRIAALPDGRALVIVRSEAAADVFDRLAQEATPAGAAVWDWLAVRSGVPMITPPTQEQFVAQAANFDVLGGVDFRKGCYTGQEIIARMQYLGRLKERLFAFRSDVDAPAPGTRLYGAAFADQPSGMVVNSAPDPPGGSRFLAVAQIVSANAGTMTIGAPDGPVARRESLPYAIPDAQPPRGRIL